MQASILLALAASTLNSAAAHRHRHQHTKRAAPANPIKVQSHDFLCNVTSDLPVQRDLGFVGKIQDTTIYTYGDTQSLPGLPFYMTSDSSSIGTDDPCYVLNTQRITAGDHPTDFIAPNPNWGNPPESNTAEGFGGTNVVPTSGNEGMVFFLKNHRPIGGDDYIAGAGVASVQLSATKNVTTNRLAEYWWDARAGEPWYGDIGAYTDGNFIWGYGHHGSGYTYLTRVLVEGWQDLENWEYFDATTGWSKTRMYNPTPEQALQWNDVDGAAWQVMQGQMIWSPYYNKIVWVYTVNFADSSDGLTWGVYARTADRPIGPWSSAIELYTVQKIHLDNPYVGVYCAVANPYFDDTGKSIVVTVDNGADTVQATKVIFE